MTVVEKAKAWLKLHPPCERIVDHKIMQSYRHEYPIIRDLIAEVEWLTVTLEKIDAIRNCIIGTQTVNWSAHVYPLVAALNGAGFQGQGYEDASKEAQTLIEQRDKAMAEVERLKLDVRCLKVQVADRGNSYKAAVKENEKLRATLTEVSGCQTDHGTEKLCDGCLLSIADALMSIPECSTCTHYHMPCTQNQHAPDCTGYEAKPV